MSDTITTEPPPTSVPVPSEPTTPAPPLDLDQQIAERRAALLVARAAVPEDDQLSASATRKQATQIAEQRAALDRRIRQLDEAVRRWRGLPDTAADLAWRDQLIGWRATLAAELLAIHSPIRDPVVAGRCQSLQRSVRAIDTGLKSFADSAWSLETSALGALMEASGYVRVGADPARNFIGSLHWNGSLREVEKRLTAAATDRVAALAALGSVTSDNPSSP